MGRWAALMLASTSLSCCQAFLLPSGTVRTSRAPATGAMPLATRPVISRCCVPGIQRPAASRALKTRVCAVKDFAGEKEYDIFLAELIFSQSDVRDDVLKNLEKAGDEGFLTWLEKKVEGCDDLDERVGLKSLLDIIKQVKAYVDTAIAEEEAERAAKEAAETAEAVAVDAEVVGGEAAPATKRTNEQVWEEMRRLQRLGTEAAGEEGMEDVVEALKQAQMSPFEGLPDKVRSGYEELLSKLVDRAGGETLEEAVEKNYDQCDVQFLTLLNQKAQAAAGTEQAAVLTELGNAVNSAMKARMAKASENLQRILAAGNPAKMEETVTAMAERGEVDDALVLLLQANLEQAESAGAKPAAEVLKRLAKAAQTALDSKVDPEKKLLRQLLRTEAKAERLELLSKAFRQRAKVVLADGSETPEAPEVAPPKFIEVVKSVIRNFGNVGEAEIGFADKLDNMISEAEEVATELYGETQTPQDQQDRAWKDTTVSVFDLENLEEDGKLRGEEMPWANDQYDGMSPEMVKNFKKDDEGNIIIGGG